MPETDPDVASGLAGLRRVAFLLERQLAPTYRIKAFRGAASTLADLPTEEVLKRVRHGTLTDLAGIGPKTSTVFEACARGTIPAYLAELEAEPAPDPGDGAALLAALRGDLHTHSDWSDGGSPILEMAQTAVVELGHQYMVLTDHSPNLTVANGLSADRLRAQLEVVAQINAELAPFRLLTGIEVDILEDGSLDQDPDLLAQLDVVVASVHSKLRSPREQMTRRMVQAIANPHMDVLGHCTGRMVMGGRKRPESEFDADLVFEACRRFDVAVEVNCRPERLDPPRRLLRQALEQGCLFSIDTDAHAPGQLDWQAYGCARASECGVPAERVINTWDADTLLEWCAA
ncbi:MAG TPA: PHP domain-containing protein [Actinomycetes bacterium]|nr:PHP domain-containing protein [Actinomycetes bacterium]